MLGSIDDIVSPEDQIDLVTGGNFVYLGVRYSGHADIIQMGSVDADEWWRKLILIGRDENKKRKERQERFILALTEDRGELMTLSEEPDDVVRTAEYDKVRDVKDVVFVIHGIRDEAYWGRENSHSS